MLHEMLTGQVPYDAETPMAVVLKHITAPLPLPREVNPVIPETVERVVLKALAKAPADRYQSAGELAGALKKTVVEVEESLVALPEVRKARARLTSTPLPPTPTPSPTPSGGRIIFDSDRDGDRKTYVMYADGSGKTNLTNHPAGDYSPTWIP
jgi:serine/threonine protein kinase